MSAISLLRTISTQNFVIDSSGLMLGIALGYIYFIPKKYELTIPLPKIPGVEKLSEIFSMENILYYKSLYDSKIAIPIANFFTKGRIFFINGLYYLQFGGFILILMPYAYNLIRGAIAGFGYSYVNIIRRALNIPEIMLENINRLEEARELRRIAENNRFEMENNKVDIDKNLGEGSANQSVNDSLKLEDIADKLENEQKEEEKKEEQELTLQPRPIFGGEFISVSKEFFEVKEEVKEVEEEKGKEEIEDEEFFENLPITVISDEIIFDEGEIEEKEVPENVEIEDLPSGKKKLKLDFSDINFFIKSFKFTNYEEPIGGDNTIMHHKMKVRTMGGNIIKMMKSIKTIDNMVIKFALYRIITVFLSLDGISQDVLESMNNIDAEFMNEAASFSGRYPSIEELMEAMANSDYLSESFEGSREAFIATYIYFHTIFLQSDKN